MKDHRLFPDYQFGSPESPPNVLYEKRSIFTSDGERRVIEGLHAIQITLNNPKQGNSYTTEMVKGMIAAFQDAGMDREAVAVVLTGAGDKFFCTGGNTKEYAEYYSGRPMEYAQYMWLFDMMVNSILLCQLPVICRVNGPRIAGGQEIGMACDFTIAANHATFGQAGPRHGSAPIGGSTDFLPLFVGAERAMGSGVLCKSFSAQEAKEYGLITNHVPSSDLDVEIDKLITILLELMPDCTMKTVTEIRGPKWERWARNFPSHRQWLALNMMTEGRAGFNAYNLGTKETGRTVNFIKWRKALAEGRSPDQKLINEVLPGDAKLDV